MAELIFQCLMLFIGRTSGSNLHQQSQRFFTYLLLGCALTWSDQKKGPVKQKPVIVIVVFTARLIITGLLQ